MPHISFAGVPLTTTLTVPKQAHDSFVNKQAVNKPVVYQVFTRLFGNKNTTNKPWGTLEENGVGKFADFDSAALQSIKSLGVTHIWYTGVPHHALVNDYSELGISMDDPDVVKGRAGSPYAVKDYYNVNPDLAIDPANRLDEFSALIARTHEHGMKVIIDIVPNHVARNYHSISKPDGVTDFGQNDNTQLEYARNNNFYYVVNTPFSVSDADIQTPLGGDFHPLSDGKFNEFPAKWTGNGSRLAKPNGHDWYETVKINYGIKPDGSHDFPTLPDHLALQDTRAHFTFWQGVDNQQIPNSWIKFKQITEFWLSLGVDGFRYDMAEMVPVAFWSYLNSNIKQINPDAFLLAEVYDPNLYRDYIHLGKMDHLYDKVGLYDTLKAIIHGEETTSAIEIDRLNVADIDSHMLHFLENHDEQRIASPDFADDPIKALPAMVVSTTISRSPTLIYFGQELGEDGSESAGFGAPTRTSIFDYIGVPAHQGYMNGGKFDGGQSTDDELNLRDFYARLLNLSHSAPALLGEYAPMTTKNNALFAFTRYNQSQQLLIIVNFSDKPQDIALVIPAHLTEQWNLTQASYQLSDLLSEGNPIASEQLAIKGNKAEIALRLKPFGSKVLSIQHKANQDRSGH
nr:alpha-amylase family protein [Shewanella nanhaiensis]